MAKVTNGDIFEVVDEYDVERIVVISLSSYDFRLISLRNYNRWSDSNVNGFTIKEVCENIASGLENCKVRYLGIKN